MPLYEYICEDGTVLELIRPMAEADEPVADPEGRGRVFRRKHSTFQSKAGPDVPLGASWGGCCPCGKRQGACGS